MPANRKKGQMRASGLTDPSYDAAMTAGGIVATGARIELVDLASGVDALVLNEDDARLVAVVRAFPHI